MIDKLLTPEVVAMLNEERDDRKSVEAVKKSNERRNIQRWLESEFPIESILIRLQAGTADALEQKIVAGWIEAKLEIGRRGPKGKSEPWSFNPDLFWAAYATDHIRRFWKRRDVRVPVKDAIKAACRWTLGPTASETAIDGLKAQVALNRRRTKTRSFRHT